MNSAALASWAQALFSAIAVMIAIWTVVQQVNRERDNRIVDDASFANYINDYLLRIDGIITEIVNDVDVGDRRARLRELTASILAKFKERVMDRLQKLVDLPLTDWPDIQFANAFYDTWLQLSRHLGQLEVAANDAAKQHDDDEAEREEHAMFLARQAESDRLQDDVAGEEYLGSIDDGLSIALPPRGRRLRFAAEQLRENEGDDVAEQFAEMASAKRVREWEANERSQLIEHERRERLQLLRNIIIDPLREVTQNWSETGSDLGHAIERYVDRANRFGLAATYEERARRSRRKVGIFR